MAFDNLLLERDGAVAISRSTGRRCSTRSTPRRSTSCGGSSWICSTTTTVRVVVITGAGEKSFVAGADINELAAQTPAPAASTRSPGSTSSTSSRTWASR